MGVLNPSDEDYMREAYKEAQAARDMDEVPVGAVIIHPDQGLIARAHNMTETLNDPTAHAETIALTQAAERTGDWRLEDCSLFVTLEPCPMCAGALVQSRIDTLVYGTSDEDGGACGSLYNIVQDHRLNHHVEIRRNVLEEECRELLQSFFNDRRDAEPGSD